MSLDTSVLFQPITIGSMQLDNRIVMAPMTRSFAVGGLPGPQHAAYYSKRAAGGVGLIVTEGTVINRPSARNEPGIPFFHGDALAGWGGVVEAVHGAGGKIAPQIWHVGAVASGQTDWQPESQMESPSGLNAPDKPLGQVMSEEDVADTIAAFARAAADAKRLGFDCVEVHGAHGYLIDQFFWQATNLREGGYGGASLPERARFAAEVVAAIRAAVGPDFPLMLRVSQWKQQMFEARLAETPDAMAAWLSPLVEAGVDVLHCSQRRFWTPEFPELDGEDGLNFAGWAKKLTGARTISVGSVGLESDFFSVFAGQGSAPAALDKLVGRMEKGEFDMIAVGRALITDPDWAAKVREGRMGELLPFDAAALAALV